MKGLSAVAERLAWMDRQGIDRQVVGGWPDWFGYDCQCGRRSSVPALQTRAARRG
jgi:hypothetical protein